MGNLRNTLAPLLLCTHFVWACGEELTPPPDAAAGDTGTSDGGSPGDAGPGDTGSSTTTGLVVERYGRYTQGPTRAVLSGTELVLVGAELALVDPETFGEGTAPLTYRGGLRVLDSRSGKVRLYTEIDGLPIPPRLDEGVSAPAPIYDLDWIERDRVFIAAAWTHLVRGAIHDDGALRFEATTLRAPDAAEDALISTVVRVADTIYVGTDRGFAVLDATDLGVERWHQDASLVWTRQMAKVELAGPALLALAGPEGSQTATRAFVLRPDDGTVHPVRGPEGGVPTAVGAMPGAALVAYRRADGRAELRSVLQNLDGGYDTEVILSASALDRLGTPAFIPARLSYDASNQVLALGGSISFSGPVRTGGLAIAAVTAEGELGAPRPVFDRRDPLNSLLPWQVHVLHVDAAGRWYVAGWRLCSEHKAGVVGLLRLERPDLSPRLVRPFVTGVREIAAGPDGATWLGLKDQHRASSCEGVEVQQHVCRLRADGACEIWTPRVNTGEDVFAAEPGATAIAFGAPEERRIAIATHRDATFVRDGDTTLALATQLDPGLNLAMTDAAWSGDGLWLGSRHAWDPLPGFPPQDVLQINLRTPQGLGYVDFNPERSERVLLRRYVRSASDQTQGRDEIEGLPSSDVRAVRPLPGTRRALVALGAERHAHTYDHLLGELAPTDVGGGLAVIDDRSISSISAPDGASFSDVVDLVLDADEAFALDATLGVLALDLTEMTSRLAHHAPWSAPERALSMARSAAGEFAVGTTKDVYVLREGRLVPVGLPDGSGYVWSLRYLGSGVLEAGTDGGLLRLAPKGTDLPPLGPEALEREPWPLELGCHGELGCACYGHDHCAPELSCGDCGPDGCQCVELRDPCAAAPGSAGCACEPGPSACERGLECGCEPEGACLCESAPEACDLDCSCSTPSGCSGDKTCQGGVTGFSCV